MTHAGYEPNMAAEEAAIEQAKQIPAFWIQRWFFIEVDENDRPPVPKPLTPICYTIAGAKRALVGIGIDPEKVALVSYLVTFDPTQPDHLESFWLHYQAKEIEERECLN